MFTGIIQAVGEIYCIDIQEERGKVTVASPAEFGDYKLGESIAVNGVCLTVMDLLPNRFSVDVSTETLSRTTFGGLKISKKVNIERSVTPTQKMGGHFVMGHVDCMGTVHSIERNTGEVLFQFTHPPELSPYLVEKGTIAIDGISLTIFDCGDCKFTVSIIPFTLMCTNLNERKIGDSVNLECDMIGKYVYKACESLIGNAGELGKDNRKF